MAVSAALDPFFRLRERGTGVLREVRGGVATFFALAYIVVLNPLILGIGLFIALIGLVDAGFVTRVPDAAQTTVPVQLGPNGELGGWPVLVFCLGVLGTFLLLVRKVPGAILISIVGCTVVAVIVNSAAHLTAADWGLIQPKLPHHLFASPDFGLLGRFSLFGGFVHAGVVTAVVFIFTLILSDFFDAMGTIVGVTAEAGLLDERGEVPGINRVLFLDGLAAAAGGVGSCSSNTTFVESAAGVGEGARTGLASVVTGVLLLVTAFMTPLTGIVPQQAAAPALVVVGFLMLTQIRDIPWDDLSIAVPSYLAIALMPFTYSITDGIGAAVIAFVAIRLVLGRLREIHPLMILVALLFVAYFSIGPIEQWLGVR